MNDRKLILPSEIKVCATCTYWDGERTVDPEMRLVVVDECCLGECLVSESSMGALAKGKPDCDCLWDDIDDTEHQTEADKAGSAPTGLAARGEDS